MSLLLSNLLDNVLKSHVNNEKTSFECYTDVPLAGGHLNVPALPST